jgi:hypothetical protein
MNKLKLQKEIIAVLSSDELDAVVGAYNGPVSSVKDPVKKPVSSVIYHTGKYKPTSSAIHHGGKNHATSSVMHPTFVSGWAKGPK